MDKTLPHLSSGKQAPRLRAGMLALCLCLCVWGCTADGYEPEPAVTRTVLFYMGGDNNLSGEVTAKIEQIKAVPLPKDCRVVIYKDVRGGQPQLLELADVNNTMETRVVQEYPETNSASAETFVSVLQEIRGRYPCPFYALVLFSHASGWLPEGTYSNPASRSTPGVRSVIVDGTSEMELPAFAAAIPDGMFGYIVFEACHMAGIEVAWELKDKADYIVASSAEIVSPGFTTCYKDALPQLYMDDLPGFCRVVESDYLTRGGDYKSLTLSIIDTHKLDQLPQVLQGVGLPSPEGTIQSFDRNGQHLFFDFGECFSHLLPAKQAVALQEVLDGCVVWKTSTPEFMPTYGGFRIESHSGLTTYIPQTGYTRLNEAYRQLKWYKEVLAFPEEK